MIRTMLTAAAALTMLIGTIGTADAVPCRDAKGKFIKCPPVAPAAGTRCRNTKGQFAKCGTPGAKPSK